MVANRAAIIETINRSREKEKNEKTSNLRLAPADDNAGSRIRRLVDLASSLMREAQVLARDKAFVDESANLKSLDLSSGIDFYSEVERFETALIKLALEQSQGN